MIREYLKDILFSVVDLETSGFSFDKDEILEICIFQIKNFKLINEYETLIRPSKKVKLSSIEVHGIDNDMLMVAPDKRFIAPKVIQILSDTILVEHNLNNFDSKFLENFLDGCPWKKTINTISLAKIIKPNLKNYNLRSLCKIFAIKIPDQHSARADAEATAKLFISLLEAIQSEQLFINEILKKWGLDEHVKKR